MKPKLAQAIVDSLSFSNEELGRIDFEQFSQRDWQRTLPWLHDNGLALYFLQKLKNANASSAIPPPTLACLEESLAANRQRAARLATQFERLNRSFDQAGVLYAAVKGLTLVPEFCPEPYLRHQSDFDYLVDDESLPRACRALEHAGYALSMHSAAGYVFRLPSDGFVPTVYNPYTADAPHTVELHLSLWGSNAYDIFLAEPGFCAERTVTHQRGRSTFRGLREEDLFLFLVAHVFYHISSYWLRLSWLYEMAYFLNRRATDTLLWARVEQCMGDDPVLHEIVALVTTLATHFFEAPVPPTMEAWPLRPPIRLWIQRYSRVWAFGNNQSANFSVLPTAKLTLFLLQQYVPDAKQFLRSRLVPSTRLASIAHTLRSNPERMLDKQFRRRERIVKRAIFHLAANLRYICERPRWGRLNRLAARSSAL
ncbi:MAG: nucleotidyltransferase family protein [Acidobacteriia bacterium]|nr:nucleotidyltransferase family protein [Terriglobia bacterium]